MSHELYRISDRELLKNVAAFHSGFHTPAIVLEGLTEEQATAKPHGLTHSIADLVGHMHYWQDYFNSVARDGFKGFPEHAEEGWPKLVPGEWNSLRDRFLGSIEATRQLAATSVKLEQKMLPDDSPLPFWERESVGSGLLHAVIHNSHHLGQVITLRQLMNLWPPAAGSMTW